MKVIKYLTFGAIVLAAVSAVGTLGLGYVIDSKTDDVLSKLQSRIPGLELKVVPSDRGLFSNSGRLYLSYGLNGKRSSPDERISFAVDYSNHISFLSLVGNFRRVRGFGNLDDLFRPFISQLPEIKGSYSASVFKMGASAQAATNEFTMPLADGRCTFKPINMELGIDASMSARASLKLSNVDCVGDVLFAHRNAYVVDIDDFAVRAEPELDGASVSSVDIDVSAGKFALEASTLYLIGFGPDDEVKDPSLREGLLFKDPELSVNISSANNGLSDIGLGITGSYAIGMPFIREGALIPMQSFDKVDLQSSLSAISLKKIISLLSKGQMPEPAELSSALSSLVKLKIMKASFRKDGGDFDLTGEASIKAHQGNFSNPSVHFSGRAGQNMVDRFCENGYSGTLQSLVQRGAINLNNGEYHTDISFDGSKFLMNGIDMSSVTLSDDER